MLAVPVSAAYQLSASHSSAVIMSSSKDVLKRNQENGRVNAQHLGKLSIFVFLGTHLCHVIFYQTAVWSIILVFSLQSLSLPGSHTSTICVWGGFKPAYIKTKENLILQTFFLIPFRMRV